MHRPSWPPLGVRLWTEATHCPLEPQGQALPDGDRDINFSHFQTSIFGDSRVGARASLEQAFFGLLPCSGDRFLSVSHRGVAEMGMHLER